MEVKKMEHVFKLVCKECEKEGRKQPLHFLETVAREVNKVTVEGEYIEQVSGELDYYQCPQCGAREVDFEYM